MFIGLDKINFQPEKIIYQHQKTEIDMVIISIKFFFLFFFENSNFLKMTWLKNPFPLNKKTSKKVKIFFKKLCNCSQTHYSFSQQNFL